MRVIQSGHIGDLIYSLSATKKASELHGEKIDFHIGFREQNTTPNHPGGGYCMNLISYAYIKPLLEFQPYIQSVQMNAHPDIVYDFDKFRRHDLNLAAGDLRRTHFFAYPELTCDLTQPCVIAPEVIEELKGTILLNFSTRYRNNDINYKCLKEHKCVFFGYEEEYDAFCTRHQLDCEHLKVKDALELAQVINSVKLVIGNQSSTFALAEQMKVKRMLESYHHCPNVIPMGGVAYDYNKTYTFVKILNEIIDIN